MAVEVSPMQRCSDLPKAKVTIHLSLPYLGSYQKKCGLFPCCRSETTWSDEWCLEELLQPWSTPAWGEALYPLQSVMVEIKKLIAEHKTKISMPICRGRSNVNRSECKGASCSSLGLPLEREQFEKGFIELGRRHHVTGVDFTKVVLT